MTSKVQVTFFCCTRGVWLPSGFDCRFHSALGKIVYPPLLQLYQGRCLSCHLPTNLRIRKHHVQLPTLYPASDEKLQNPANHSVHQIIDQPQQLISEGYSLILNSSSLLAIKQTGHHDADFVTVERFAAHFKASS
jgi:hypothetical protein